MPPAVLVRPSRGAGVVRLVLQAGASVGGTAWVMGYASGSTALVSLAPFAGAAALGSMLPATGLLARPVLGVRTRHARLALTFDDGPDPTWTPRVLDLLEAHGQRGTFFVIGARAAAHPALLRAVVARGHELANHTWAHGYGTAFVPPRSLARELRRVDDLLEAEVGVRSRWFRPPVGVVSPWVARGAAGARLTLVTWSAAARDGVARTTVPAALARLDATLVPGAIVALHDGVVGAPRTPIIGALLPAVLDRLAARGLRSVTLSALAADAD